MGDRREVGVGLGGVGGFEALVEFIEADPPLPGRLAKHVGSLLTVGVGHPHEAVVRGPGKLAHEPHLSHSTPTGNRAIDPDHTAPDWRIA